MASIFSASVNDTLGAAFIGYSISCAVFGVLSTQVFSYFQHFPADNLSIKILVSTVWILELVDQIFIAHAVYHYTVSTIVSPLKILTDRILWSLILQVLISAIAGTIVKILFALRVWKFSGRNIFITAIIMIIIFVQVGFIIAYTVEAFRLQNIGDLGQIKVAASVALATGAVTDIITAISLSYFLRKLRTGYQRSDSLVNTLTRYAINTGALTSTISLLTMILYDARSNTFQYMGVYFVLSKLYAISYLCTLNTRTTIGGRGTENDDGATTAANQGHGAGFTISMQSNMGLGRVTPYTSPQAPMKVNENQGLMSQQSTPMSQSVLELELAKIEPKARAIQQGRMEV